MSDQDPEWAALMRAGLAGDGRAYAELLTALAPVLRAIVARGFQRTGMPTGDVEDVVQETLLAIHLKRQTWRSDQPIGPWIRAIARNKLIDALRRRGRRGVEVNVDDFAEILPAQPASDDSLVRDISRHLDQLSPVQQKVVKAISVDGLSIAQASKHLTMKDGAVRVALHRGLAALSVILRGHAS